MTTRQKDRFVRIIGNPRAAIAALVIATCGATLSHAADKAGTAADAMLLPPNGQVDGETFGMLTARWWQWSEHLPIAPFLDPDGRLCELGQEGAVWFLAGTDGTFNARRECVIPAGRHILVPIINMRYSNVRRHGTDALPIPCKVLQQSAAVNNERLGSAVALIDGVRVTDVARYRVRSDGCFPLVADDETSPSTAADGYWLLIKPLAPGRHTLTIGANYAADDDGYGRMVQNFEYVLHVGGRTEMASRPSGLDGPLVAGVR